MWDSGLVTAPPSWYLIHSIIPARLIASFTYQWVVESLLVGNY